jgi:hypothetical protein
MQEAFVKSDDAGHRFLNTLVHHRMPARKPARELKGKMNAGLLDATYSGLDWLLGFRVERFAADRFP